jgi:hypothetical protein
VARRAARDRLGGRGRGALIVSYLVPGWWFIVVGALTGSIVGAFIDDE